MGASAVVGCTRCRTRETARVCEIVGARVRMMQSFRVADCLLYVGRFTFVGCVAPPDQYTAAVWLPNPPFAAPEWLQSFAARGGVTVVVKYGPCSNLTRHTTHSEVLQKYAAVNAHTVSLSNCQDLTVTVSLSMPIAIAGPFSLSSLALCLCCGHLCCGLFTGCGFRCTRCTQTVCLSTVALWCSFLLG